MDLIHRKEKYREYLKKIEKVKTDVNDNTEFSSLKGKADHILNDLKSQQDGKEFVYIISLLTVPLVFFILALNIRNGYGAMLIPLVLVLIFIIYYRLKMIECAKMVKSYRVENKDNVSDENLDWLSKKIEYVIYGMEVKLTRLRLVKLFYVFFFPTLLVFLYEYFFETIPFSNIFIAYGVAFLLGGIFWHYFFTSEVEDLEFTQDDLRRNLKELQ